MKNDSMFQNILYEYIKLSKEYKEKESLHDKKVAESALLETKFNKASSEYDSASKVLHEKQANVYGKKHGYVYKCEKRRFRSLFVIGCFIPVLLNIIPSINGVFSFEGFDFLFNTLPFGFILSSLDLLFLGKKNSSRFFKNYSKSKEGKFYEEELKQIEQLKEVVQNKLNAYNETVLRIHQNENEINLLKKECKDISYRMSRICFDYFRLMSEECLSEEEMEDVSFELKRK